MGDEIMINYSVYMLENPIDKSKPSKAYGKAQVSEVMSFRAFVKHIAEHGGHKRSMVKGVICDMCECLVETLLEGKKVQLDELGDFWVTLTTDGANSMSEFTAANISGVNIIFTPGEDFMNLRSRAEFSPVASRAAQTATLKAEKAGETTVDLEAAKKKGGASSDNTTTPDENQEW